MIGSVYHAPYVVAAFLHFCLSTELHTSTARLPHTSGSLYLKFSYPIQYLVPVSCGCIRLGEMKLHNLYLENEYGVPPSKLGPTSASCLLSGTAYRRLLLSYLHSQNSGNFRVLQVHKYLGEDYVPPSENVGTSLGSFPGLWRMGIRPSGKGIVRIHAESATTVETPVARGLLSLDEFRGAGLRHYEPQSIWHLDSWCRALWPNGTHRIEKSYHRSASARRLRFCSMPGKKPSQVEEKPWRLGNGRSWVASPQAWFAGEGLLTSLQQAQVVARSGCAAAHTAAGQRRGGAGLGRGRLARLAPLGHLEFACDVMHRQLFLFSSDACGPRRRFLAKHSSIKQTLVYKEAQRTSCMLDKQLISIVRKRIFTPPPLGYIRIQANTRGIRPQLNSGIARPIVEKHMCLEANG